MATFVATLFVIICVLLIIVVLLQKGRGVGLGGAFGGAGQSAFGTRTGDVFTWVTIVLTAVFLLLSIAATVIFRPEASSVEKPTFSPPSRAISRAISVSIQVEPSKAQIFYTTDGSEPTRNSLRYDAPIRVDPGTTAYARGFLNGWKDSEIAVAQYPLPGPATAATTTASRPVGTRPGATRPGASAPATLPAGP